ncbi:MAG TPA: GNAT family N-acetyltransferase [Saprospiraceae bacterium]|nr:GNAT family N-acetyltransferase [Saprospiraceae bacterium]HNT19025.1 GNAT family N-acetyltransferase [Saprospiraceae bacterium]
MIRRAVPSDLDDLLTLFKNTISFINSRDYNPQQTEAWISSIHDRERWLDKIQKQYFILYLEGGRVLGFASLDQGRHIDLLYVHHKRQGEGIAALLLLELETEAKKYPGPPYLNTHASITALPFFTSKGFTIVRENKVNLKGVELHNYEMKKALDLNQEHE